MGDFSEILGRFDTKSGFLCAFASKFLPMALRHGAPGSDLLTRSCGVRSFAAFIHIYVPIPVTATLSRCSDRRKSVDPSAPIAYATSVSPPNEAVAWLCALVLGAG